MISMGRMWEFVKGKECRFMRDFRECILYEDKHLIVCYKPPGFPVQSAGTGAMDIEFACMNYLHRGNPQIQPFVGIVQRLDQPAEGLMVLAKNRKITGDLEGQVRNKKMEKIYLAVAEGRVEPLENDLEDWLVKDSKLRMGKVTSSSVKGAKRACLHYQVLGQRDNRSLLEIHLSTGRYHQIRVQLSHRGWPLAGDSKYGREDNYTKGDLGLCAYRLRLFHPVTKKEMHWKIRPQGDAFAGWDV